MFISDGSLWKPMNATAVLGWIGDVSL